MRISDWSSDVCSSDLNLPTGLLLVMMGVFIPESAKFLMARGRREEAQRIMARFGSGIRRVAQDASGTASAAAAPLSGRAVIGKLAALSLTALCWGFVNFGQIGRAHV